MEKAGGIRMVNFALQPDYAPIVLSNESEKLSTTIKLSEVIDAGTRLEASAFSIEAHNAITALESSGLPLVPIYGEAGLCKEAHNAFRFKRIYVNHSYGIPFLTSSEIVSLKPKASGYLSRKLTRNFQKLIIKQWDVLISCSGTIGNVGLASKMFTGQALSQDAIRLRADDADTAGYITAFLRGRFGRPQVTGSTYGSVVQHIEPLHLKRIVIPDISPIRRIAIGRSMCEAGELRDEANRLLDEADRLLHERLNLPYINEIASTDSPSSSISRIRASQLMGRLEGGFHNAAVIAAEKLLSDSSHTIVTLDSPQVTEEIRAITKFRKRIYVEKGIPLLNSKQLFQIDPVSIKFLAKGAHTEDLPEIELKEEMIVVTCSGTIGKVQIIPHYMEGWASSQDAIRILASKEMNSGYLYAWLASDYGNSLIKRQTYGSVVVHIDREMLGSIPILLPSVKTQNEIGNLVLKANQLRDQAWRNEQEAISKLENLILKPSATDIRSEELPAQKIATLKGLSYDPDAIPIWELAAQAAAKVPDEEWERLPKDLAKRFDYYQRQEQKQD
jgi:type I restriction enzyme, S subunit